MKILAQPDCTSYPCREECCSFGVDVWPHERDRMIADGIAAVEDFSGPWEAEDGTGDLLYRTALGARGCVFLSPARGCRLHSIGYKPEVCRLAPRNLAEAEEMVSDGILPCRTSWQYVEIA